MKNDYVRGGPDPSSGGYGGYGYGGHDSYGYGSYGGGAYGEGNGPQRSLKDYLMMFRERIWYFVVAFFIIFAGSILYTFNKTKIYTSTAVVELLRDAPSAMGQTDNVDPYQIRSAEDLNTQISKMNSLEIIRKVEKRLQDGERERFMAPYVEAFSLSGPLTPLEVLGKNRKIVPQRMTLVVNISYSHPDPDIAANVANLFAEEYISYVLNQNIDGSMKNVEDLRMRAEQQKDRVEEIELKLAAYRESQNAISLDAQENIAREQLVSLNQIKTEAKNIFDQLETKSNLIESYRREKKDLWQLSFISDQQRVAALLSELSSIRIGIATLSKRYREKHPTMVELLQQLQETEAELTASVQDAVDIVQARFFEMKSNYELASQRLAEKEADMISLSKIRVEYSSMLRDSEVQQMIYQNLISRMSQEKIQVNIKNASAQIVDKAFAPSLDDPSSPNIIVNLAAGFAGGISVGIGLVFLVSFLDDRVKSAFDIEGSIGLPLLGVVPRIKKMDSTSKAQAVASNFDRHVTETFRSINSTLKLNEESRHAKVIVVTSTVPGEGKSFVSTNISLTFANHGEKTLLLDADLRLPNVARSLQLENGNGLLDYIENGKNLDDVIVKEVYPNMDVLPTGGRSKNPTQVLNSAKFEALLAELRDEYDRIVIDSPPLAAVSDALSLLSLVDGVIYVIKFNTVKRKTAMMNVRRLFESSTPVFGAVLNNITSSLSSYHYSHYTDSKYQDYYISSDEEFTDDINESNKREESKVRS